MQQTIINGMDWISLTERTNKKYVIDRIFRRIDSMFAKICIRKYYM